MRDPGRSQTTWASWNRAPQHAASPALLVPRRERDSRRPPPNQACVSCGRGCGAAGPHICRFTAMCFPHASSPHDHLYLPHVFSAARSATTVPSAFTAISHQAPCPSCRGREFGAHGGHEVSTPATHSSAHWPHCPPLMDFFAFASQLFSQTLTPFQHHIPCPFAVCIRVK